MRTYTARDLRNKQAEALNFAASGEVVTVARRGNEDVILISKTEYETLKKAKFDQEFATIIGRYGEAFRELADK